MKKGVKEVKEELETDKKATSPAKEPMAAEQGHPHATSQSPGHLSSPTFSALLGQQRLEQEVQCLRAQYQGALSQEQVEDLTHARDDALDQVIVMTTERDEAH